MSSYKGAHWSSGVPEPNWSSLVRAQYDNQLPEYYFLSVIIFFFFKSVILASFVIITDSVHKQMHSGPLIIIYYDGDGVLIIIYYRLARGKRLYFCVIQLCLLYAHGCCYSINQDRRTHFLRSRTRTWYYIEDAGIKRMII